jgi:hypothetical protein
MWVICFLSITVSISILLVTQADGTLVAPPAHHRLWTERRRGLPRLGAFGGRAIAAGIVADSMEPAGAIGSVA